MTVSVSVVIPVKDSGRTLAACLQSIRESTPPPVEIIMVDDGSTDDSLQIAQAYPLVRIIHTARQSRGVARARNLGAQAARGEVILFIDSDIVVQPDAFTVIKEKFDDPAIQAIVGLLSPETEYRNFSSDYKNLWIHYTYLIQPHTTSLFYTSIAAIRRSLFLECGGFDEFYRRPGLEDTDFGNKLYKLGYAVHLTPELQVRHLKYYRLSDLFKLDYHRAMGLVKIQLRRGLSGVKAGNLSSVPLSFILSIPPASLCCFALLLGLSTGHYFFIMLSGVLGLLSIVLNRGILSFLYQQRGILFTLRTILFLLSDSIVLVFGAGRAIIDYLGGRRY
ncbi:glycosyltransferase family 2 protein [candidate division CSSED10-310 bacterium]|uniref:Glycosyltransferase family 2 protein n=1 Tax=candidate division CSSED10-310 bacterium TaxID=2855610 RepID=A0ABV6YWE8_UNCC1